MTQQEMQKFFITVHPDVNNNINNNSSWGNIRALLQEKTYITIQSATA